MLERQRDLYGAVAAPRTIDETLDTLATRFGITAQLEDLPLSDPPAAWIARRHCAAAVHRDWDENDAQARHFGGFALDVPGRIDRGEPFHELPREHREVEFNHHRLFFGDLLRSAGGRGVCGGSAAGRRARADASFGGHRGFFRADGLLLP